MTEELSEKELKQRRIEQHNKQAKKEVENLYNKLDARLSDALLSRDDRDSLLPLELNQYKKNLKFCEEAGYSGHAFTSRDIKKMKTQVEDYENNVKKLSELIDTYVKLDISDHSKVLHLEDIDLILKAKSGVLSGTKIKKATAETTWTINNIAELKQVEQNMQDMNTKSNPTCKSASKLKQ